MPPKFLVLSEDGSHRAVPALVALTKKMCQLVVPALRTHLLHFEPPEERLRRSLTANKWKSRKLEDQRLRVDLVRYIAAHLARPDGFVVFHFDGDTRYGDRASCTNAEDFEELIVPPVSQLLRQPPRTGQPPRTEEEVERIGQKLIRYVPHYCVEAWTYYNLPVLEGICRDRVGDKDNSVLAAWKAAPAEIEEVERPFKLVSAGKDHNRVLAERAYPADTAFEAGKSFHDTVVAMLDNRQLVAALQELA